MEWEYVMDDGVHKTALSNEHQLVAGVAVTDQSSRPASAAIVVIDSIDSHKDSPPRTPSKPRIASAKNSPGTPSKSGASSSRVDSASGAERPNNSSSSTDLVSSSSSSSSIPSGSQTPPPAKGQAAASGHRRNVSEPIATQKPSTNPFSWNATPVSTRPTTLPPKSAEEEAKHRKEYEAMMASFNHKLEEENKRKEEIKRKREQRILDNKKLWQSEILPQYEKKKKDKRTRELWWQGIPPLVRAKVWPLAISNDLHITPELYKIMVQHAKNRRNDPPDELGKMKTVELIPTDLPRTFPALAFYQPGGPSHDTLKETLEAFAQFRPDIGYVQGMSYLAAILLLYLDPFPAFCSLCNLLNRPCQLAFYRLEARAIARYTHVFRTVLRENMPDVSDHLNHIGMSTEMFLLDWILTIYAKSLPLDISSRIWDVYILEGDAFLFRTAVAIFRVLRKQILDVDLGGIRKVFGSLCDQWGWEEEEELFHQIHNVKLTPERFDQLIASAPVDDGDHPF